MLTMLSLSEQEEVVKSMIGFDFKIAGPCAYSTASGNQILFYGDELVTLRDVRRAKNDSLILNVVDPPDFAAEDIFEVLMTLKDAMSHGDFYKEFNRIAMTIVSVASRKQMEEEAKANQIEENPLYGSW